MEREKREGRGAWESDEEEGTQRESASGMGCVETRLHLDGAPLDHAGKGASLPPAYKVDTAKGSPNAASPVQ